MIVALLLPKGPPRALQDLIRAPRRASLQALHELRNRSLRSDQEMGVVGHHDKGMQDVVVMNILSV